MHKLKRRSKSAGPASQIKEPLEPGYPSRSLAKGLQILEFLGDKRNGIALRDLAVQAKLGKASTLRLLRTLEATGYVRRDTAENYVLARPWAISAEHDRQARIREAALPVMRRLNAGMGETVALAFLFDDVIRVIEVLESTHHIRMANYRGGVLQPYASSLGKAITAYQTEERVRRLLYTYGIFKLTSNTLTDFRAIHDELEMVREQGFAWDREETVPGGACVGVPVFGPDGCVHAAFSMSMPKARMTGELEKTLPQMMKECGTEVSSALRRLAGTR